MFVSRLLLWRGRGAGSGGGGGGGGGGGKEIGKVG